MYLGEVAFHLEILEHCFVDVLYSQLPQVLSIKFLSVKLYVDMAVHVYGNEETNYFFLFIHMTLWLGLTKCVLLATHIWEKL